MKIVLCVGSDSSVAAAGDPGRDDVMATAFDDRAPPLDTLDREAHAWVRRLKSGEATEQDAEALQAWCQQSPAHAAAFAGASELWDAFGPAGRIVRGRRSGITFAERAFLSRRAVIGGALAASVGGVLVARPPFGLWPTLSELRADFRTDAGEQRHIVVTDGVSIQLNTRTSITVSATKAENGVELVAGEASITLPLGNTKPFSVLAGEGRTTARQARFDVRFVDASVCVTCMEDEIVVEHGKGAAALRARQQITYADGGLGPIVSIDPDVVSAWKDGVMIFRMTPLAEVIEELNRYRSGRIWLLKSSVARSPVNGRFRIDRTDDVLVQIERAFGVTRRTLPGGIVLLS